MIPSTEYLAQLEKMSARCQAWLAANPDRTVTVQFNFPRKCFVIATIGDALEQHYVSANEAGLELIKQLWTLEENEPTVGMVRAVLEFGREGR